MYSVRILTLFNIHYRATDTCLDIMAFERDIEQEKRRKDEDVSLSRVLVAAAATAVGAAGGMACFFLLFLFC